MDKDRKKLKRLQTRLAELEKRLDAQVSGDELQAMVRRAHALLPRRAQHSGPTLSCQTVDLDIQLDQLKTLSAQMLPRRARR